MMGLALALILQAAGNTNAAELVMVEELGCPWCEAWNKDIGEIYSKTAEARIAPLRRIEIDAPWPTGPRIKGAVVYTPTFLLMEDDCEVGRIVGYPGEDHFWGLLGVLIDKLEKLADQRASACAAPSG